MTYRFTIPLDYTGLKFVKSGSSDQKFLKMMLPKRYNGGYHIYEFIKINIALYEHQPKEPMNQAIMTYSSLTDLSKLVVKYLRGIAYDSLNQVVGINANKYNGEKQKIEIEVIAYEE
jgi:hypothetical protein